MASELLKNRALIQKLKEPDVPVVNFGLADSAIESLIEPDVLPQPKPDELFEERERIRKDRLLMIQLLHLKLLTSILSKL